MDRVHRIGVISDTHGLLRPEALHALKGSEMIIHAGDVGRSDILDALGEVAPVVAVRGNIDRDEWGRRLPATEAVRIGDALIYLLHNLDELDIVPRDFAAVITGHTHRPVVERREGVLYLNPGSAGPRRFTLPITLALMEVRGNAVDTRIVDLETFAPLYRAG